MRTNVRLFAQVIFDEDLLAPALQFENMNTGQVVAKVSVETIQDARAIHVHNIIDAITASTIMQINNFLPDLTDDEVKYITKKIMDKVKI